MPELPDVQVFKKYLDSTGLHQKIKSVSTAKKQVLKNVTAPALEKTLTGHSLEKAQRHGKYLFIHTDSDKKLLLHFGMTGRLRYYKDDETDPKHTRVRFDFSNGYHLAYICQRMLGRVGLVEDIGQFLKEKGIGPDALAADRDEFTSIIGGSNAMIKTALMDQGKIAGIGNIYSDEILFQAGIHPRSKSSGLDDKQLKTIYKETGKVCRTAIKHRVNPDEFPKRYLTSYREEGADCPVCDGTIQTMKINNRTCYYCSSHQSE